jgi:hypothetical protein
MGNSLKMTREHTFSSGSGSFLLIFHISYVTFSNVQEWVPQHRFPEFSIIELYFVSGNWTDWDSDTDARREPFSCFMFNPCFDGLPFWTRDSRNRHRNQQEFQSLKSTKIDFSERVYASLPPQ